MKLNPTLKLNTKLYQVNLRIHLPLNAFPSIYSASIFYVSKHLCHFLKISYAQGRTTLSDVAFLYWDHKLVTREREVTPLSKRKILSRVKANTKLSGFSSYLSVAFVTKKHKYFPGICDAIGATLSFLLHQASVSIKTRYSCTLF